jgi:hypothetical protein
MLMQPQNPDPKFDFMLKNQPQAKHSFGLTAAPKFVKIGLGVVFIIILLIIVGSFLGGRNKGLSQATAGALARGQETLRVSAAVQQLKLQDPTTQALAATVTTTLTSDQQQLENYLATNNAKLSKLQLAADTDKTSDSQMQTASQNNSLDQAYITYLQQSLSKYQTDLQTAYNAAGPKGKALIKGSLESTNTLLTNPPLKS